MTNQLRHDLHDLAEEVNMVDLRDRSVHTSRQIRRRRTAVTVMTAVLTLAAGATVVGLTVHPPGSQATAATASGGGHPKDFPFAAPPASAPRLGAWTSVSAASLPGTAYFFSTNEFVASGQNYH